MYANTVYQPPSVKRAIADAMVSESDKFGNSRLTSKNSIESMTGQTGMDYLMDKKLRNKDLYREMKDKVIYGMNSSITSHSSLNNL